MYDTAFVSSIENDKIIVIPLIKGACLSCKQGCAKRGNPFEVVNPKKLPVKLNSIVKIGSSKKAELFQAVPAIVFPLMCAVIFYGGVLFFENNFGKAVSDGLKSFAALSGFAIGAFAAYIFARTKKNLAQGEILELCN